MQNHSATAYEKILAIVFVIIFMVIIVIFLGMYVQTAKSAWEKGHEDCVVAAASISALHLCNALPMKNDTATDRTAPMGIIIVKIFTLLLEHS